MKSVTGFAVAVAGMMLLVGCRSDPTPTPTAAPLPTATRVPAATPTPTLIPGPLTVEIKPSKDTTIFDEGVLANGSGEWIFAGRTRSGAIRRGLVAFDVASEIPAGATIMEATLTLVVAQTSALDQPVGLHSLLKDWGEGPSDAEA
ncbi:MAG: hypothetical protein O3B65_04850, partial [Chloroflexi bacterium]|nr:hypothetical protein [Chloroflexota bacterium]